MELVSYSALMGEQSAFLTLKIDTEQPVELRDFVGAFTSLGNEFERPLTRAATVSGSISAGASTVSSPSNPSARTSPPAPM